MDTIESFQIGEWAFKIILIVILGPFLIWIGALFYNWVRWLFTKEKEIVVQEKISISKLEFQNSTFCFEVESSKKQDINAQILALDLKPILKIENKNIEKGRNIFNELNVNLNQGVYFFQIETNSQKITKKFLVN